MIIPIERQILIEAARIRADLPNIQLPDAIHLATARNTHSHKFITNDKRLKCIQEIEIILLSEEITDATLF